MSAQQSTWGLVLQGAGVVATVLAILVALFGEKWRAAWFPPKLRAELDRPRGKLLPNGILWFCVRVSNGRRWRNATEVRVALHKVEHLDDKTGEPMSTWEGTVPLERSLDEKHVTVGPDALSDLFAVYKHHELKIFPKVIPTDLDGTSWATAVSLRLTFQAHSNEVDSPTATVRVDWDGFWGKTDDEWDRHLKVTQSVVE